MSRITFVFARQSLRIDRREQIVPKASTSPRPALDEQNSETDRYNFHKIVSQIEITVQD